MTDIANDFDPEDAWDAGDPIEHKLALLDRVADAIKAERARDARRADARKDIALDAADTVLHDLDEMHDMLVTISNKIRTA